MNDDPAAIEGDSILHDHASVTVWRICHPIIADLEVLSEANIPVGCLSICAKATCLQHCFFNLNFRKFSVVVQVYHTD
jgi:hypothetical protein